jgi:hypothetical protein
LYIAGSFPVVGGRIRAVIAIYQWASQLFSDSLCMGAVLRKCVGDYGAGHRVRKARRISTSRQGFALKEELQDHLNWLSSPMEDRGRRFAAMPRLIERPDRLSMFAIQGLTHVGEFDPISFGRE